MWPDLCLRCSPSFQKHVHCMSTLGSIEFPSPSRPGCKREGQGCPQPRGQGRGRTQVWGQLWLCAQLPSNCQQHLFWGQSQQGGHFRLPSLSFPEPKCHTGEKRYFLPAPSSAPFGRGEGSSHFPHTRACGFRRNFPAFSPLPALAPPCAQCMRDRRGDA